MKTYEDNFVTQINGTKVLVEFEARAWNERHEPTNVQILGISVSLADDEDNIDIFPGLTTGTQRLLKGQAIARVEAIHEE